MKYIVFLTKNKKSKINNLERIYIGIHATKEPYIFDGYLGDGIYVDQPSSFMYPKTPFQCAVKKFGVQSFERITLYIYDNENDAYERLQDFLNDDFLKSSHVYNTLNEYNIITYKSIALNQFNYNGKLIKHWNSCLDACKFYNLPLERFLFAIQGKYQLLNSFWNFHSNIKSSEYNSKYSGERTYLYNTDGKLLNEYFSRKELSDILKITELEVQNAVKHNTLVQEKYYISNKLMDMFIYKPRKEYIKTMMYVYDKNSNLIGQGIGKKIMPFIREFSWKRLMDIITIKKGWNGDRYLSLEPIEKVPEKIIRKASVDIYDHYGNFVETLNSLEEVRKKYHVPKSKLKDLERGNKYYDKFIFKYHNK